MRGEIHNGIFQDLWFVILECPIIVPQNKKTTRKANLSRCFLWCRHQESNSGPSDYKSILSNKPQQIEINYNNYINKLKNIACCQLL